MNIDQLAGARIGFIAALRLFAVWRDGLQVVGVQQRPLAIVIEEVHAGLFDDELKTNWKTSIFASEKDT